MSLSLNRARNVDLAVAEICRSLQQRQVLELGDDTVTELQTLQKWARSGVPNGSTSKGLLLKADVDVLYFVLAAAAAPNFMVGRVKNPHPFVDAAKKRGFVPSRTLILQVSPPFCVESPRPSMPPSLCTHAPCPVTWHQFHNPQDGGC